MRENAAVKARRLLAEGRVIVTEVDPRDRIVTAVVRGSGHLHRLAYRPGTGWTCSCPVRSDACSHLRALRSVVAVDLDDPRGAT